MKWHDYNPATKSFLALYVPRYNTEEDWLFMEDIQEEVKRKTGVSVSRARIGKIAKKYNLKKKVANSNLYHRRIIEILLKNLIGKPLTIQGE